MKSSSLFEIERHTFVSFTLWIMNLKQNFWVTDKNMQSKLSVQLQFRKFVLYQLLIIFKNSFRLKKYFYQIYCSSTVFYLMMYNINLLIIISTRNLPKSTQLIFKLPPSYKNNLMDPCNCSSLCFSYALIAEFKNLKFISWEKILCQDAIVVFETSYQKAYDIFISQ